jgi:hypothetical protein
LENHWGWDGTEPVRQICQVKIMWNSRVSTECGRGSQNRSKNWLVHILLVRGTGWRKHARKREEGSKITFRSSSHFATQKAGENQRQRSSPCVTLWIRSSWYTHLRSFSKQ